MKVQNNYQQYNNPQFKGFVDTGFRFLATNQAIGANAVDLSFMVTPRTASDMYKRGPAAGFETLRREIMGTVNDTCIGLFGAAAGWLIAGQINKNFGLDANSIFTAPETLNILAENKAEQIKNNRTQLDYIKKTLTDVKAYNPTSSRADSEGFVKISENTIDEVAEILDKSLKNELNFHKWTKDARRIIKRTQYDLKEATSLTTISFLIPLIFIKWMTLWKRIGFGIGMHHIDFCDSSPSGWHTHGVHSWRPEEEERTVESL